jgi:hypothetical protein
VLERATGQLGTPARTGKEGVQADATVSRTATVSAMTNARGWTIFAGFIVSWLLLATVVVNRKILDITKRESCAGLGQSSALSKAQASIGAGRVNPMQFAGLDGPLAELIPPCTDPSVDQRRSPAGDFPILSGKRGDHSAGEINTGYGWPQRVRPARRSPERAFGPA